MDKFGMEDLLNINYISFCTSIKMKSHFLRSGFHFLFKAIAYLNSSSLIPLLISIVVNFISKA